MALCDGWFYYPTREVYQDPADYRLSPTELWIDSADGVRLHAWLFRAVAEPRALVVHFHGNAGNMTGHFPFVAWMPAAGLSVLCFDYRGYGRSSGTPSREGLVTDGISVVRFAADIARRQSLPLVIFGQSLGGAVAAVAAAETADDIAGLVLDGAFSSHRREAAWVCRNSLWAWPVWKVAGRILVSKGYDPVDYIGKISPKPVLIMHGKQDRVVGWQQAIELYEAARMPKELWLVEDCDHYEVWEKYADEARRRFLEFAAFVCRGLRTPPGL